MTDDRDPIATLLDVAETYRRVNGLSEDAVLTVKGPEWMRDKIGFISLTPPPKIVWDSSDYEDES